MFNGMTLHVEAPFSRGVVKLPLRITPEQLVALSPDERCFVVVFYFRNSYPGRPGFVDSSYVMIDAKTGKRNV